MWPKLLFDLLPHFSRLIPMADKYLSGRGAADKAQEAALAALGGEVRGELGRVTEAHSGLSRQLQDQVTQIAELGVDVARTRLGVESIEERVAKLEKKAATQVQLLAVALGLLVIVAALVVGVMVHVRR